MLEAGRVREGRRDDATVAWQPAGNIGEMDNTTPVDRR
jgi:hypothetical protein